MAISATTDGRRDELLRVARLCGENLSRHAFGERGPDLKVTLADMEQFLGPLVEAMAGGFLGVSAAEQTQRLPDTLPCPACGRACSRAVVDRTLRGEHGPFTWSEPRCYCEPCERSFFPSTDRVEDRPA
jgi:hypothetical protein